MAELLITAFLLLALENALFSVVFKNTRFLAFSYETGNVFLYAVMLGAIPAVSVIAAAMLSEAGSVFLAVTISVVLSGAAVAYEKFAKRNCDWYFSLSLVINSAVVVLLGTVFAKNSFGASQTGYAVLSGIAAAVSALCFCGAKSNFCRVKRNIAMTCVTSAVLVLMAIATFLGFAL